MADNANVNDGNADNFLFICSVGDPERVLEKTSAIEKNDCTVFAAKRVRDERCCENCVHSEKAQV